MKLTLPNIQKMDLGGEDSIRLISKKSKNFLTEKKFEELLNENETLAFNRKKRIKQGDISKSWMDANIIQNQGNGLRRKDAENIPWKDIESKRFALTKLDVREKKQSKLQGTFDLTKSNLGLLDSERLEETQRSFLKETKKLLPENLNSNELKSKFENEIKDSLKNDELKRIVNTQKDISDISDQNDSVLSKNSKESVNEKNLNPGISSKINEDLKFQIKESNFNIDDLRINMDDFTLAQDFSSSNISTNDSKIINPVIKHLVTNISQNYSYSIDKILHSFDSISFKSLESGFTVKMRLYPEELGELELHVKKEGLSISMVAYVMNEEAKQVMMRDTENLSNYLMNQGYNLDQIMVEVKNEGQGNGANNFDRIIAENRGNFNHLNPTIEIAENKRPNFLTRIGYHKGIGRLVNKLV